MGEFSQDLRWHAEIEKDTRFNMAADYIDRMERDRSWTLSARIGRFVWCCRYARRIRHRSGASLKECWEIAKEGLHQQDSAPHDWRVENPVFTADEEMTYWTE